MKKMIALLLTAVSLTAILAGCSKGSAPTKPEDVKGETFDKGKPLMAEISVRLFPTDGWAFTAWITLMSMRKVMIPM